MMKHTIRLSKTDSVNSVNKTNTLDVQLKNTSKAILYTNFRGNVDLFELFKSERNKCNNYRLIFNINPYCTNVLFNPFTEIVKEEGSNNAKAFICRDSGSSDYSELKRRQMISDTKYSNEDFGNYTYHCGYDIFDNHILRNINFKVVNDSADINNTQFNTLSDRLRKCSGETVKFWQRKEGLSKAPTEIDKHLYNRKDILSFEDSVAMNLREENGWFGFTNITNLKCLNDKNKDISKWAAVINNHKSGGFIQMYPDSSLFSFTPTYNSHRNRLEYNWEFVLTYPYENDDTNELVYDITNNISSLLIMSANLQNGTSDEEIIVFRTYTKHNLERDDEIQLYYRYTGDTQNGANIVTPFEGEGEDYDDSDDEYDYDEIDYTERFVAFDTTITIRNLGNLSPEADKNYYFYINKSDLPSDFTTVFEIEGSSNYVFRFRKVKEGMVSSYYVRKLKPIPNFKARHRAATLEDIKDRESFNSYVIENATNYGFDKEVYNTGFANTIYGDSITQLTYTDTVNTELLKDNLGRPLTEIYLTIIKTNYGNEEWYNGEYGSENVETSHCFGSVNNGFVFSHEKEDSAGDNLEKRKKYRDIKTIGWTKEKDINGQEIVYPFNFDRPVTMRNNVPYNEKIFYCDVVEFSPTDYSETVISEVNYRFNTFQRDRLTRGQDFITNEIVSDDYNCGFAVEMKPREFTEARKEGYYYKPHYKIQIRDFSNLKQGSHKDITIVSIRPRQENNILIEVQTRSASNVSVNDIILLCDDDNIVNFEFYTTHVVSRGTFLMFPVNGWVDFAEKTELIYGKKITWVSLCGYINDGQFIIRRKNYDIPDYAVRLDSNTYLWRDIREYEDGEDGGTASYTYANNAIYITTPINFYLKRQDPDGSTNLLVADEDPSDISGEVVTNVINKDTYVVEEESTC